MSDTKTLETLSPEDVGTLTLDPRKSLEVSTSPAEVGGATASVNKKAKSRPFKGEAPSLILPGTPAILVQPVNFIGKHVVFSPKDGQLTNPIDDKDEAHAFAESIQTSGRPAIVMCITAQFLGVK